MTVVNDCYQLFYIFVVDYKCFLYLQMKQLKMKVQTKALVEKQISKHG